MAEPKSNEGLDLTEVSRDSVNSTFTQSGDQKKGEAVTAVEVLGKPSATKSAPSDEIPAQAASKSK